MSDILGEVVPGMRTELGKKVKATSLSMRMSDK